MQPAQRRVAEQGRAAPHAQLHEPRSGAHQDAERERADLGVKRALITLADAVELDALVGDDAGEHVEPADRAFRIGQRRHALFAARDVRAAARYRRNPFPAPRPAVRSIRCIDTVRACQRRWPAPPAESSRAPGTPPRRAADRCWPAGSGRRRSARMPRPRRRPAPPPRSICAGKRPVDRSPSAAENAAPASASLMSPTTPPRRCPAKLTHGGRPANAAVTNYPRHHLTTRRQTGCFETAARCRDAACRRSGPAGAWRYTRSARSSRSCRRGFRRRPCPAPRSAPS